MNQAKKENFLRNPWVIGIGTAIVSVLILRIFDWFTGTTIVNSILLWITSIPANLWPFFEEKYSLPLYGLILMFISGPILAIGLLWILSKIEERRKEEKQDSKPEWLNYLKDSFHGVQYRWNYEKNYSGMMEIQYVRPFCPKCECLIIESGCPNCGKSYWDFIKGTNDIKALIYHRLEQNYGVKVH